MTTPIDQNNNNDPDDIYSPNNANNPDYIINLDKVFIAAAEKAAKQFSYGDIISKDWLDREFMIETPEYGSKQDYVKPALDFLYNIFYFTNYLLVEHKMCLVNVRGQGYQIILPQHQADFAMCRANAKIEAELVKANVTLTHINENLLSPKEIQRRNDDLGKIAALAAFSRKRLKKTF